MSGIVPRGTKSFTYEVVAVNPLGRVAFLEGKASYARYAVKKPNGCAVRFEV
jgi:hypothetical protein